MRASDRAYEALRNEIIDGGLPPGTVLTEVDLAERLGVSRTPVREALSRIVADGLVVPGGRGVVVTDLAADDVVRLFDVRIALETQQARLAARHGDPDIFRRFASAFEGAIVHLERGREPLREHFSLIRELDIALDAACENPYLVSSLDAVRTHLARIRHRAGANPARMAQAAREHATISQAIAAGDAELAANAVHVHLANSLANIVAAGSFAARDITEGAA